MRAIESHQTFRQKTPCKSRVRACIQPQPFITFPSLPFHCKHNLAWRSCLHMRSQMYSYSWPSVKLDRSQLEWVTSINHSYINTSIIYHQRWQSYTLKWRSVGHTFSYFIHFVFSMYPIEVVNICLTITLSNYKTSLLRSWGEKLGFFPLSFNPASLSC